MRGGEEVKKFCFGVLEDHWAKPDIYFHFYSFFSETNNHLLSLISTKINKIWEIGFDYRRTWYSEVKMTFGQNSVTLKFGGRGCRGENPQKLLLFGSNRSKIKTCITYPKISLLPVRLISRGDRGIFPLFDRKNELLLSPFPPFRLS